MKKLFIALSSFPLRELGSLLFPLLWGLEGLFAQVTVSNLATNYPIKQILFIRSWTAPPDNNPIRVIDDCIKIEGTTTVDNRSGILVPNISATGEGSAVSVTGLPDSGTSTIADAYNHTVSTANGSGCTNAEASGNINADYHYGCLPSSLTLDSAGFTSTDTWARNGITISSPVTVTYCEKPDYSGGSSGAYKADCRSYNIVTTTHYFSWCFIKHYAAQLCPSPWRVPTREDFCQYANGGIGADCSHTDSIQVGVDGWHNLGQIGCDGTYNDIPNVFAWSGSEFDTDIGFNAWASWEAGFTTSAFWEKCCGFILRCVR